MSDGRPTVLRAAPRDSHDVRAEATVLRSPSVDAPLFIVPPADEAAVARSVAQPDPATLVELDPELAKWIADQLDHERHIAFAEGHAAGRAEADAQLQQLAVGLQHAVAEVHAAVTTHRSQFTDEVMSLAEAIATAVIDRTPHDEGRALVDRIRNELAAASSNTAVVAVHPDDLAMVAATITDDQIEITVDHSLGRGETVITTEWATLERTREAAWNAVRAAIEQLD